MKSNLIRRAAVIPVLAVTLAAPLVIHRTAASAATPVKVGGSAYIDSVRTWRAERLKHLTSDTGWLTVAGFHWLEPGENLVGSDPSLAVPLPKGSAPARVGDLRLLQDDEGDRVIFDPAPGSVSHIDSVAVHSPTPIWTADGGAERVRTGRVEFWVIPRGGRYAIRVRDPESPIRKHFLGIDCYKIDPAYRVEGVFHPGDAPDSIEVPSIMGYVDTSYCPGKVTFTLKNQLLSLLPMTDGPTDSVLFFVFADRTTGKETYGAGRFLYSSLRPDGTVTLDFNEAYNPPCAFNPFTTCPLPPDGNTLPVAVEAGEKNYAEPAH